MLKNITLESITETFSKIRRFCLKSWKFNNTVLMNEFYLPSITNFPLCKSNQPQKLLNIIGIGLKNTANSNNTSMLNENVLLKTKHQCMAKFHLWADPMTLLHLSPSATSDQHSSRNGTVCERHYPVLEWITSLFTATEPLWSQLLLRRQTESNQLIWRRKTLK